MTEAQLTLAPLALDISGDPQTPVPMAVVTGVNFPMLLMSAELLEEKDVHQAAQELVALAGEAIAVARPAVTAQLDDF